MDTFLLFRKRSPLTEDGLPWLSGNEEHTWCARRNTGGVGRISAILARALLSVLQGNVLDVAYSPMKASALVKSNSSPDSAANCWLDWSTNKCGFPHGEENKITYHMGVLAIIQAVANPEQAKDFLLAYIDLLKSFQKHGKTEAIKPYICRASDELYYWLAYGSSDAIASNLRLDRLATVKAADETSCAMFAMDAAVLTDPIALNARMGGAEIPVEAAPATPESTVPGGFVGWQVDALTEGLANGDRILMAGATGTGKTFALHQVVSKSELLLVTIEGKEGLTDLDFIGAILPQEDGSRRWVDGPLLRAVRSAENDPVLLFLDEVNRIPRAHLNILLGLMNPKSGNACRLMGLSVIGDGPFYMVEAPMTSEIVACPAAHLRIVAAGNFGRAYQVYDLDPAVRRRFDTVLEFEYLSYRDELALVRRETPSLGSKAAEVLVKVAQETRRLLSNGELPGCVDTASLLNWAKKCQRNATNSQETIMKAAGLTWGDTVCGRDHTGRVNQGSFKALEDYIASLAIL